MGKGYDASGDMLNDGVNQYLYDGEGRICAVTSTPVPGMTTMTGYLYDADGARVAKGRITAWSCDPTVSGFQTTNDYILGPGGQQAAKMGVDTASSANPASDSNSALTWQHTNVYAAGTLIATYDNDGLHFYFNDPLGTRRAQTDYAGVLEQTCSSLPFGDGLSCSGGNLQAPTEHHFTGKERDNESGNDYFGARYYASSMGRFMSPDPLPWPHWQNGGKDELERFEQFISNPQNFNQYMYVRNNPLTSVDPDGLDVYVVTYTTGNRHGDDELKRAAETNADDIRSSKGFDPKKDTVVLAGVKTKEDFKNVLSAAGKISDQFGKISSVSLFSHSGDVDGPTFHTASGTPTWFTKSELSSLQVNWSSNATASFFGCRSADNFAQNFANSQHVRTFGFTDGVDFSGQPNTRSKWYVLNGQFQRYMIDQSEKGLQERDPQ